MADAWVWLATENNVKVGVTTSRRQLTTSTVVVAAERALLVDPAWEPDELDWIAADLARRGLQISGFATHAHHDHVLWHPRLGGGPRWASTAAAATARTTRGALVDALGVNWPADLAGLVGALTPVDGARLPWPGAAITMITHDAHSPGHTALWLAGPQVLIAGDMLSDVELPLLGEETLAEYSAGLLALRPFVDRAEIVIPGHGRLATGSAARKRWAADRAYVDALSATEHFDDPRRTLPNMAEAHSYNVSHAGQDVS